MEACSPGPSPPCLLGALAQIPRTLSPKLKRPHLDPTLVQLGLQWAPGALGAAECDFDSTSLCSQTSPLRLCACGLLRLCDARCTSLRDTVAVAASGLAAALVRVWNKEGNTDIVL